ncbi:MAG TPA: hypothetical protein VFG14_15635, partial [Chthoniobacteraceae bacterium]|nr:hypothetical protein [Chthoniobacteraceae bacterium]
KNNPERPNQAESPEQKRRKRDIQNLTWLLKTLHLPTLDQHALDSPHVMQDRVLHFWEGFNSVINNSLFHLYDNNLATLLRDYHTAFRETVRHGEHYHSNVDGSAYIFSRATSLTSAEENEKVSAAIRAGADKMVELISRILHIVRQDYLEVSIDDTNRAAWLEYVEFKKAEARALEDLGDA